jgi:8-oxo-dGTP pyrophosphatase MutT (NUDIX family)
LSPAPQAFSRVLFRNIHPDLGYLCEKMSDLHLTIKEILNSRTPKEIENLDPSYVHAAVLIPLLMEAGCHKVLFTERTHRLAHHKGQISFPGGTVDAGDSSLLEAALREADEEIGLKRKDVKVLGRVDDALTVASSFVVHPFVGLIPHPYEFAINRAEVKRLITVPLKIFHPENKKNQRDSAIYNGVTYRTIAYAYEGDLIWGATARIMQSFMDILGPSLPLPKDKK